MDFKKLHEQFKDDDSPSVEGQVRWLQKQGFLQHQIEQAMIATYTELEHGNVPVRWKNVAKDGDGQERVERRYSLADHEPPTKQKWDKREVKSGFEFDQVLLEMAKKARTDDLNSMVKNMELFEKGLRKKWKKAESRPWYKKLFGVA